MTPMGRRLPVVILSAAKDLRCAGSRAPSGETTVAPPWSGGHRTASATIRAPEPRRVARRLARERERRSTAMVAISIMIEGQMGLTWPRWERLCAEVEALGFAGLFRSDHFTGGAPPDQEALETVVSLAYL